MNIPPASGEDLAEFVDLMRANGMQEFQMGNFKLVLGAEPVKDIPVPQEVPEEADPNTGLTPSEASDLFWSSSR